jgi:uncharacterized membrane protein
MGNLFALAFDRSWAANEVLKTLQTETALQDAFVVERAASGRCAVKRAFNHGTAKAPDSLQGGLWGEMVRLLFLNSSLDHAIRRGGSALFILIDEAAENRVLRAIKPYRGRILKTSLPDDAGRRLQARFTKAA